MVRRAFEQTATGHLGFSRYVHAPGIHEALGYASELFESDSVLLLEVFDDS